MTSMNLQKQPIRREPFVWPQLEDWPKQNNGWVDGIDRCANCPNDLRNGGSGICHCTIPSMYGPSRITV